MSNTPFVEKYRPKVIADVVGNSDTVGRLKAIAEDGNMPHLILSGPPGTGKTTSVLCLARALLGDHFSNAVLELNASDDRGIDTVRNKIKMFAQTKVSLPEGRFKVIILDEADSMTSSAQQALRRIMEIYAASTRFVLACNQSSKIIEPIQSRCAILRYTRLSDKQVLKRVLYVAEQEGITYNEEGLEALIFSADGDMRQALNNMQSTHAGFGFINKENVFKICDQPHPRKVQLILRECLSNSVAKACVMMKKLYEEGYSAGDICATMMRVIKTMDMNEAHKLEFMKEAGLMSLRVADGVSSSLQMSGFIARLCQLSKIEQ
mmetsp:Transcript_20144/g.51410  ORF Transcript_20144/g.51410 Transcript_20144/m.51410 type:complete len:321 (+) Transcript_20144:179-1141(+)|eukprot:CAMPEP_0113889596 /NCGR_PEP_ID=MMETSP0780_2-20120614/13601_1 /TAXON_ID=652834 /ORGANISM="Palpitomonas bilix" /LENGTH=320 /DNA_ID=CAMNT_0000878745 /DNA_START=136 /DNA_END=1098 /DNA_ORIENTATION=+ /assembly_acc=CAM_ASM_000599